MLNGCTGYNKTVKILIFNFIKGFVKGEKVLLRSVL